MNNDIFILEDDGLIRELIGYILAAPGLNLHYFGTVRDFEAGIHLRKPALALLDIMLPDGNGVEVCKEIKADKAMRDIPVILMSANINNHRKTIECEAEAFISKPFDIDELKNTVERFLPSC